MSLSSEKAADRAAALARRATVPDDVRRAFAERLARLGPDIVRREAGPGPVTAAAYHPVRGEADTAALLAALAGAGIATVLPVMAGRGNPLRFARWSPGDPVAPAAWGIPEPLPAAGSADPDVLFVPLAGFDRRGHRLGYGAGFYDATLAALRARKTVHAVGVAFSVQELDAVPAEPHDEPLDVIVTETEIILCAGRR